MRLSELEEVANDAVHPMMKETITNYKTLIASYIIRDVWLEAMAKELMRLAQGWQETKVTNTVKFIDTEEISHISKEQVVIYAQIVIDYCPQKEDNKMCQNHNAKKFNQLSI